MAAALAWLACGTTEPPAGPAVPDGSAAAAGGFQASAGGAGGGGGAEPQGTGGTAASGGGGGTGGVPAGTGGVGAGGATDAGTVGGADGAVPTGSGGTQGSSGGAGGGAGEVPMCVPTPTTIDKACGYMGAYTAMGYEWVGRWKGDYVCAPCSTGGRPVEGCRIKASGMPVPGVSEWLVCVVDCRGCCLKKVGAGCNADGDCCTPLRCTAGKCQ